MADESGTKVPIGWRGYKSSVFPNLPKFSTKDLKDRLRNALRSVRNITLEEREYIRSMDNEGKGIITNVSAVCPSKSLPFKVFLL